MALVDFDGTPTRLRLARMAVHPLALTALAWFGLEASGCAAKPKPLYLGPPRQSSEVALLVAISSTRARVYGVDDHHQRGTSFELDPGRHQIWVLVREVMYVDGMNYFVTMYCGIEAELEKGHRYELRSVNEVTKGTSRGQEVQVAAKLVDSATKLEFYSAYCQPDEIPLSH